MMLHKMTIMLHKSIIQSDICGNSGSLLQHINEDISTR